MIHDHFFKVVHILLAVLSCLAFDEFHVQLVHAVADSGFELGPQSSLEQVTRDLSSFIALAFVSFLH